MSAALYDAVARIARHEAQAGMVASLGIVRERHGGEGMPGDHAVTVELRDRGLLLPRVPVAIGSPGFHILPAVDDLVVVLFAEGDIHGGVVVGALHHADLPPPKAHADGFAIHLPAGEATPTLKLDVPMDGAKLTLALGEDVSVTLDDRTVLITAGELSAKLTIGSGGLIELKAGSSTVTLKQDGDVTIKAAGKFKVEAAEIEIAGSGPVKIKGATVDLN